jgi:outer membrane protein OmpA-like peptidoglycan-associated protein
MLRMIAISLTLILSALNVAADAAIPGADLAGSQDPALLKRYEGSLIVSYDDKAFDEYLLPIAPLRIDPDPKRRDGHNNLWFAPTEALELEGRVVRLVYLIPEGRSPLEVVRAIDATGRMFLYGILFDFDQATVKLESSPVLAEIATLLRSDAHLKLLVVGHTDNAGGFDYNRDLSQRRAEAVVTKLVQDHGADQARLFPVGVSFAAPVASNQTEEGRSQNRRVELVRY